MQRRIGSTNNSEREREFRVFGLIPTGKCGKSLKFLFINIKQEREIRVQTSVKCGALNDFTSSHSEASLE